MTRDAPALFRLVLARAQNERYPFRDFIESETDTRVRGQIIAKAKHLSAHRPEDYQRPFIATLDGPIRETRTGQLRLLFSLEEADGLILLYGGERKKTDAISQGLIHEAKALRQFWLDGTEGLTIDLAQVKGLIKRKRIKWDNE